MCKCGNMCTLHEHLFFQKWDDFSLYLARKLVFIQQFSRTKIVNLLPQKKTMKKILALALLISLLYSCSRSVTPYQAATHHYTSCKNMR
jgi:hypothetical protein